MTVLVTGASGSIGPAVVAAFRRSFPEVRAYVRRAEAAEPLRELGAKVAVGEADDPETLGIAMYGVFTVCHLLGAVDAPDEEAYREANAGSVETALEVASRVGVRRFLFLSTPGADPAASHPYLRSKGEAEELIRGSGLEHAIVRTTHVYGPGPGLWFSTALELALASPPAVLGRAQTPIAPVYVDDVAAVLAAGDDRGEPVAGTWALEGPDATTAAGFVELLEAESDGLREVDPDDEAAVGALLERPPSRAALEFLAAPSRADAADAAAEFGVARTSLLDGLRDTIERSSAPGLERWMS
jgi:NADH dehydrogenase